MIWLQSTALAVLAVAALSLVVLAAGALATVDRQRRHSRATAALPLLAEPWSQPDGLCRIPAGDFRFRARVANLGGSGDPLILLHGFPQTSAAWEPLIAAAAGRGHRVVAFDQRGYSPGARPAGVAAYAPRHLVGDVLAVADAAGFRRFHLVGHDWGAAVGWGVAMAHPGRLLSFAALSIGHPLAFGEALRSDADQRRRSRYFLLFRTPWLAEAVLGFNRLWLLRRAMYRWMPEAQVREYLRVFAEPGALSGALNWYRAMADRTGTAPDPHVDVPVLFVWGNRDPAAGRRATELTAPYVRGPYEFVEMDAGHWLLERQRDRVIDHVLGHIATQAGRPAV